MDSATVQGSVVSQQHYEKVLGCIETAKQEGGKILTGGEPFKNSGRCADGWFIKPTIIEGLSMQCKTNQEEIFGPVVTLTPFKNDDEALALANDSKYGLCTSVWTKNINRALRFSNELETGMVWINTWLKRDLRTPFGGSKLSGMGREGGWDALHFFSEPKNVCIALEN